MSKIYDKYIELKSKKNDNTLYLFKSGIFFIFIDNDAKIISNYLNLKLCQLNNNVVKCGFPSNSLSKYINLLKNLPYNIEIVLMNTEKTLPTFDYLYYENINNIVNKLIDINIDNISISQAFEILSNIQNNLISIKKEYNIEKKK